MSYRRLIGRKCHCTQVSQHPCTRVLVKLKADHENIVEDAVLILMCKVELLTSSCAVLSVTSRKRHFLEFWHLIWLKQALADATLLKYLIPGAQLSLWTDASDVAIGSSLMKLCNNE
ncbi:hypothetical protein AVEN_246675-1 [Araneus ventricosus]|uniref:Reverse transcriptase/retrotransposon-derived protein RNase H-like domain-containing protein n=1 Tax=Araneus ventricosus TaxID=182803 RepID=A0A4Y2W9Z2_ARAVE|nr:hypothetical protein AVEN_246675-1 [Araneus ventricosus]